VLVARVHQELLKALRLPPQLVTRKIWQERFADINAFERHLLRNGTAIIKEQKRRLLARLNDPNKAWKACVADIIKRKLWTKHWPLTKT
jgi:polyphosphate kinase 2 (PPK2 family)